MILGRKGGSSSGGGGADDQTAAEVPFTPAGTIAATDVQAAIEEVASEAGGGGGLFDAYAYLRDQKANGAESGGFTAGAWQTRVLQTEVFDPSGIVTLAANQFTLAAGTYFIVARAPAFACNSHQAKLRDITAAADIIIGANAHAVAGSFVNTDSWVHARVEPVASNVYELQHRCETTRASNGFGVIAAAGDVEVYGEVWIYREAA